MLGPDAATSLRYRPRWSVGTAATEILGLTGIAIAQPLFDVFGRAPEVFVQAGAAPRDVLWFALAIMLVPPLFVLSLEVLIAWVAPPRAMPAVHALCIGTLVALFGLQVGWKVAPSSVAVVSAMAVFVGVVAFAGYLRAAWVGVWLRFVSVAPILFVLLFLFSTPAGSLLRLPGQRATAAVEIAEGARGPVVLMILDELPIRTLLGADGTIDAERFPGFAAFADDATWFRNATATSSNTLYSVPAILTGRYPAAKKAAPTAANHPDNLFRLLQGAYRFNVLEYTTQLCVVDRCDPTDPQNAPDPEFGVTTVRAAESTKPLDTLLDRAVDVYGDMLRGRAGDSGAQSDVGGEEDLVVPVADTGGTGGTGGTGKADITVQPARFADWLGRIDADIEAPQLSVVHTVVPHHPWYLSGDGLRYHPLGGAEVGFKNFAWLDEPGAVVTMRQRHIEMVRYTDTLLGALQRRLETLGIWDDATVIVTADHGAAFEPGQPFRSWTETTSPDIIGVPLFVHSPGFERGVIDDRPAQSVDIVPTIAGASSVEIPWGTDGVDLGSPPGPPRLQHPYAHSPFPNEAVSNRSYSLETIDVADHLDRLLASRPEPGTDGGSALGAWRIGPHAELIGRPVAPLLATETSGGSVRLGRSSIGAHPGLGYEAGTVGALAFGELRDTDPDALVVVAVDGRIGAVVRAFTTPGGDVAFSAFVPPKWMLDAQADVQFYRLGTDGGTTLHPLAVA